MLKVQFDTNTKNRNMDLKACSLIPLMRLPVALGNNNMEYLSKTYCILVYLFLRCNSKFEDYGDRVKSLHSILKLSVALNVRHDRRCWTPVLNLSNPGGQTGGS